MSERTPILDIVESPGWELIENQAEQLVQKLMVMGTSIPNSIGDLIQRERCLGGAHYIKQLIGMIHELANKERVQ